MNSSNASILKTDNSTVTVKVSNLVLRQIAKSGQCFRLYEYENGRFYLIAHEKVLFLDQTDDVITFYCPPAEYESIWKEYFDLNTDYSVFINSIPKSDTYLSEAASFGEGIRILNQDTWETIITFIISQRKNMPAIQNCVEKLSNMFGKVIQIPEASYPPNIATEIKEKVFYSFPTPASLAGASIEELNSCSLGYRSKYILDTSVSIAGGKVDPEALRTEETPILLEKLKELHGIGDKVANCAMLFAYHRLESFPIDVWIRRILDTYYGGSFDTSPYEGYAGVIQQYMFFYETSKKR